PDIGKMVRVLGGWPAKEYAWGIVKVVDPTHKYCDRCLGDENYLVYITTVLVSEAVLPLPHDDYYLTLVMQFKQSGEAYIYDLGNAHGTSVNKKEVKKKVYTELHVGDVIRFQEGDLRKIRSVNIREEMHDREASLLRAKQEASIANEEFVLDSKIPTDPTNVVKAIVQEQQGHPLWGSYAQRLLDPEAGLWKNPRIGTHSDNAAIGAETKVEIDIAGELFFVSGRTIIVKNYLDVYRFESWGNSTIPKYTFGQQFIPTTLTLDSGVTRPPPLLSEADLINCMDKAGIGTDATMHDHIKKLLDRLYATKDANTRFAPTKLGEALVMGYDDMGYEELWKPSQRSRMESETKQVSVGRKTKSEVLATYLQDMKAYFLDARLNQAKLKEAMDIFFERSNRSAGDEHRVVGDTVRRCNVCNDSDMVLKKRPDGNFMVGCLGYPQCRNVVWLPGSISEATVTTQVCNSCSPGPVFMIQFKFRMLEIPPGYNVNHLGCIGSCDEILRHLTEICGTGSRNPSSVPVSSSRGRGPRAPSSNAQQTSTRQAACVHCRQTGHSSNDCPSQVVQPQRRRRRNTQHENGGEASIPCTTCGESCVLRTANTDNNRGRKFYSCQGCNFFVWEDSMNDSTAGNAQGANRGRSTSNPRSSSARRGGHGRGSRGGRQGANTTGATFVSATGDPLSNRCFSCGDPSHFANACPNRGR
ncbi:Dna topoisomerase 3-alpha, partial [Thalictrum thalictroides]